MLVMNSIFSQCAFMKVTKNVTVDIFEVNTCNICFFHILLSYASAIFLCSCTAVDKIPTDLEHCMIFL